MLSHCGWPSLGITSPPPSSLSFGYRPIRAQVVPCVTRLSNQVPLHGTPVRLRAGSALSPPPYRLATQPTRLWNSAVAPSQDGRLSNAWLPRSPDPSTSWWYSGSRAGSFIPPLVIHGKTASHRMDPHPTALARRDLLRFCMGASMGTSLSKQNIRLGASTETQLHIFTSRERLRSRLNRTPFPCDHLHTRYARRTCFFAGVRILLKRVEQRIQIRL